MNKKIVKIPKEKMLEDFRTVYEKLKKSTPNPNITRNYFRDNCKYNSDDIERTFESFAKLKETFFEMEGIDFDTEKKLLILESENKNLKKDKEKLLQKTIDEDGILLIYEKRLNDGLVIRSNKEVKIDSYKKSNRKKEAILMLSDFHLGETIDASEMHGINEYNSKIMVRRLDRIFYYFIHYCKKYEIDIVNILLLGDLLSGCHHEELKKTNEFDDVSGMFFLQEYLMAKIIEIEKNFTEIKIEILVGNHSRIPEGRPEFKKSAIMNYEYILAKQLKIAFDLIQKNNKKKKININVNQSLFNVIDVANRKFLITHGHILSNGSNSFAGIPYYGLSMSASKLSGAFKQFENLNFDDILTGHLHCTSKVKTPIGNLYINGSTIGVGEFALYKMKVSGSAEQTMLIVEDGDINAEIILRGE